ncbi:HRI1 domain containing protein [Pyrenophora tritici-repentis]|nr:HRI1 domain containing protein [Pyrenophora tritici-repentis]
MSRRTTSAPKRNPKISRHTSQRRRRKRLDLRATKQFPTLATSSALHPQLIPSLRPAWLLHQTARKPLNPFSPSAPPAADTYVTVTAANNNAIPVLADGNEPNISKREYIYFLPYPLPPDTEIPYSIHLPQKNPLNLPSHQFEPTSTLVLTSPKRIFVDIRIYKPFTMNNALEPPPQRRRTPTSRMGIRWNLSLPPHHPRINRPPTWQIPEAHRTGLLDQRHAFYMGALDRFPLRSRQQEYSCR